MDFDRMRVAIGMEVVGSDGVPFGDVTRIVPPILVVAHPWYRELRVPFDAIADITGNQIVVTLPAVPRTACAVRRDRRHYGQPDCGDVARAADRGYALAPSGRPRFKVDALGTAPLLLRPCERLDKHAWHDLCTFYGYITHRLGVRCSSNRLGGRQNTMTMQDHLGERSFSAERQQCIALCVDTHRLSVETIEHCVRLGGAHATPPYLKLLHDTAQITRTTANGLQQDVPDVACTCAACAEVTHQAAQATEGLAPDALMQTFIRQCRACAVACHHLAQRTDEQGRA